MIAVSVLVLPPLLALVACEMQQDITPPAQALHPTLALTQVDVNAGDAPVSFAGCFITVL